MKKKLLLYSLLIITITFFQIEISHSREIFGVVINKSKAGEAVSNLQVGLIVHSASKSIPVKYSEFTDENGLFSFDDLKEDKKYSYFLTLSYKGIPYIVENLEFNEKKSFVNLKIPVYNLTEEDKNIIVSHHEIYIDLKNDHILIKEEIEIQNRSQLIYIGNSDLTHKKRATFSFYLPDDFFDLTYLSGINKNYSYKTRWGILLVKPIEPGKTKVSFSYKLNKVKDIVKLNRKISYFTKNLDIFIDKKIDRIVSKKLTPKKHIKTDNEKYIKLEKANIVNDDIINIELLMEKEQNYLSGTIAISVIILLLTLGVLFSRRKQNS